MLVQIVESLTRSVQVNPPRVRVDGVQVRQGARRREMRPMITIDEGAKMFDDIYAEPGIGDQEPFLDEDGQRYGWRDIGISTKMGQRFAEQMGASLTVVYQNRRLLLYRPPGYNSNTQHLLPHPQ